MKRRDFLFASGATALAATSPWAWRRFQVATSEVKSSIWFSHSTNPHRAAMAGNTLVHSPGFIGKINLATGDCAMLDIPLFGHEVVQSPVDHSILFTSEKYGTRAALIDFQSRQVMLKVENAPHRRFFGHAVFSADGRSIYCAEMNDETGRGMIVKRETKTGSVENEFDSGGVHPHQLRWVGGGKQLAVINYAEKIAISPHQTFLGGSRLCVFDFASDGSPRLSEARQVEHASLYHFSHHEKSDCYFASGNREPVVVDAHKLPPKAATAWQVLPRPSSSVVGARAFNFSKFMPTPNLGEALSVDVSPNGELSAVSLPESKSLVLWDWKKDQVVHVQHFSDVCRGVNFVDDDHLIVTVGVDLIVFKRSGAWTQAWVESRRLLTGNGSHLSIAM